MLLTITTTCAPATDLGYLLHKHPDRPQSFAVSAGEAHVFYPEATPERCTAALLLEVDPIALVRGPGQQARDGELGQYVNDRPYAASSMLAVAIKEAFRTALTGRCDARPDLAAARIPLTIRVPALRCRGGAPLAHSVFSAPRLERRRAEPAPPAGRVGRLPVSRPAADRRAEAGGRAQPPVRAAAGARRRQALLGVHRGGRQADPGRRRLAGRAPGEGAHHPPLPVPPAKLTRSALARLAEADDTEPAELDNAVTEEAEEESTSRWRSSAARPSWP